MLAWFNKILCMQAFIAADGHPRKFLPTKRMYQWNPKSFGCPFRSRLVAEIFWSEQQPRSMHACTLSQERGYRMHAPYPWVTVARPASPEMCIQLQCGPFSSRIGLSVGTLQNNKSDNSDSLLHK